MISAVLDANVLYSASLRDFLLWLANAKVFFPFWTEEIRNEWIGNLLRKRSDLKWENLEYTRQRMDVCFPTSLVQGYEVIVPTLQLPDPNDQHVLAAAIHKKAKYIVTFDLKDFPNVVLLPYKIEAISPDEFVMQLRPTAGSVIIDSAMRHRLSLKKPPKTVDEYLATLEQQKLPKTVAFLREHMDEI